MGFGLMEKSSSLSQLPRPDSASRLKERFGYGPKEPKVIDISARRDVIKGEFELFKEYEVTSKVFVHSAQDPSSPVITQLSAGSRVTVHCIGNGGRLKVSNTLGTVQGWVSSASLGKRASRNTDDNKDITRSNSLTSLFSNTSNTSRLSRASRAVSQAVSSSLTRRHCNKDLGLELIKHPKIGETVLAEGKVIVREEESMHSAKIMTLRGGCQFKILDYGTMNPNRLKVLVEGKIGWVSVLDKNLHEPLFGKRPESY